MPSLGAPEILVILLVALLVFGPKRLPEVGRQVAKGYRELRRFQDTVRDEIDDVLHLDDREPARATPTSAAAPTEAVAATASGRIETTARTGAPEPPARPAPALPSGSRPSRFRTPPALRSGPPPALPAATTPGTRVRPPVAPAPTPAAGVRPPGRHRAPRPGPPARGDAET